MCRPARGARVALPEKRIDEMVGAARLHFDMLTFGHEPDGTLAAPAGVTYCPIGSESSPIIQFYDSIGLHDMARRSLAYFFDRQRENGQIHCFESYTLETGFVLWTAGEHYRYTRDAQWVRSLRDKIVKACDYIAGWSAKNRTDALKGSGYGMLDGKVADPVDPYHGYMLNAGAYAGLRRSAEMLGAIGDGEAGRVGAAADELYGYIRGALDEGFAKAPVIPLSDGTWIPSLAPWAEGTGPVCLFADGGVVSPIDFVAKDALLGAVYLLLLEAVEHDELYGDFILKMHNELFTMHNTCFTQPYYSPHPYSNLRRGETGAFLEEYYYNVSAHADRETYAFWEGYNHTSPYKIHEQAWFMMRTRWMLYMEEGGVLKLLPGIPRAWLASPEPIALKGVKSYFGSVDLTVRPDPGRNKITVSVSLDCHGGNAPEALVIRIPHPDGRRAAAVTDGKYDPETETVTVRGAVRAEVELIF